MQVFIIGFAPDDSQPMNYFWDGTTQVGIDGDTTPDGAQVYNSKAIARGVAGRLQQIYTDQVVGIIPASLVVTPHFSSTAELLAPTPPASSAPAAGGGTTTGGTTTGGA